MNAAPYRLLVALFALAAAAPVLRAQDTSTAAAIELLRSDVKARRTELLTEALKLTDAQSKVFWPLYHQYEAELSKLADQRVQIIRDFAVHYDSMTDAKALELAGRVLDLEDRRLKLRRDQIGILSKSLPGKIVARFLQVDTYLSRAVDMSISAEMPFVR